MAPKEAACEAAYGRNQSGWKGASYPPGLVLLLDVQLYDGSAARGNTSTAGSRPKQEPAGRPLTGVALGDASCAGTHGWVSYGLYKQSCRRRFLGRRIFTKPGPALSARSPFELRDPRR